MTNDEIRMTKEIQRVVYSMRRFLSHCLFIFIFSSFVIRHPSFAAEAWDPSRETLVVYNASSASSVALATVYAGLREIPQDHMIGLPLSTEETISRGEFEATV